MLKHALSKEIFALFFWHRPVSPQSSKNNPRDVVKGNGGV